MRDLSLSWKLGSWAGLSHQGTGSSSSASQVSPATARLLLQPKSLLGDSTTNPFSSRHNTLKCGMYPSAQPRCPWSWKMSLCLLFRSPAEPGVCRERCRGRPLSLVCFPPQKLSKEVQNALAKANNTAEETISAMKTVRSFANEETEANVYWQKLQQVYKLNKRESMAYTYYVWSSGVGGQ